jgi:hypothetical protein
METYKVWRDRGESWVSTHLPAPDDEVLADGPASAARTAYDRDVHGRGWFRGFGSLKYIVEQVSSSSYWIVEIECQPSVRRVDATTLHDLCEDEDPAKNPRGIHVSTH